MKTTLLIGALVLASALVLGACATPVAVPTSAPPTAAPAQPTTAPAEPTEVPASTLPDLGGRTVTVAIENAYIPFNYIRLDNGQAEGWDYDALAEMCRRLNCKPEFIEIAWDGMITAVSQGQFDMAADGITITEERAKTVDFSDGYIRVDQRIMVGLDETRFSTIDELKANPDFRVGTQKGTTNYDEAVKLVGESRVVGFDVFGDVVQALINKDVDAVVIDDTAGVGYVGVNKDKIKLLEGSLVGQELGFVFPKGSELLPAFNAVLAQMRADGSLQELSNEWFAGQMVTYDDIESIEYETTPTPNP
jgi:polar amino acid transport system substrate-binding protein